MRINARLNDASNRKLSYLERETGWSISEIVRRAIDAYYTQFKTAKGDPASALEKSGFIGCGEGPSELSTAYKEDLERLATKHGDR